MLKGRARPTSSPCARPPGLSGDVARLRAAATLSAPGHPVPRQRLRRGPERHHRAGRRRRGRHANAAGIVEVSHTCPASLGWSQPRPCPTDAPPSYTDTVVPSESGEQTGEVHRAEDWAGGGVAAAHQDARDPPKRSISQRSTANPHTLGWERRGLQPDRCVAPFWPVSLPEAGLVLTPHAPTVP